MNLTGRPQKWRDCGTGGNEQRIDDPRYSLKEHMNNLSLCKCSRQAMYDLLNTNLHMQHDFTCNFFRGTFTFLCNQTRTVFYVYMFSTDFKGHKYKPVFVRILIK